MCVCVCVCVCISVCVSYPPQCDLSSTDNLSSSTSKLLSWWVRQRKSRDLYLPVEQNAFYMRPYFGEGIDNNV